MNCKKISLEPEKWIDRYYDYMIAFARKRITDPIIVEDIVQETFYAALKSQFRYNGSSKERTWLTTILKRKIIDNYRKTNSRAGRLEQLKTDISGYENFNLKINMLLISECQQADYNIRFKELNKVLKMEIRKLPKKESKVFTLKFVKEYDVDTICKKLGISREYYWVLIHRARKKISNSIL
ncbi:sigma-70 family RNA polymerase sigma factor [uncultured Aquimarina sp.]|uniref:RNA polymerase sigma factor n=1 Tax=uncultured Aquimarina sp. TaxID=575652 RepID=UPI002608A215|nr:sigma-70 family RNA polymerase sigma factor [uncultured Aquimarina sp.]